MKSRWARMAAAAAIACALTAGTASAATPSAYVYATSWIQTVRQYSADDGGSLSNLMPSEIGGGGLTSISAAASPDRRSLYVVNQNSNSVSQYDIEAGGTLKVKAPESVLTGSSPVGMAVAPDGQHAYVVNQGERTVWVYAVDGAGALTKTSSADAGRGAAQIALSPDGASAYVTNLTAGTVSQYDVGPDGALRPKVPDATVPGGTRPSGIAVSPDGARAYVTNNIADGTVAQFSVDPDGGGLQAMATSTVPAGSLPRAIVAAAGRVYVANSGSTDEPASSTISQYAAGAGGSLQALTPASVPTVQTPFGLALSPDGGSLYVAGFTDGVVGQFDVASDGTLAAKATPSVQANASPVAVVAVEPRDEQAPTVDLRTPAEGAQYALGADVRADYSCADEGGSGLQSCTGDVPDGDALDTATAGAHSFTVVARDGAGHETTVTHGYTVAESLLGFKGFLGPTHDGSVVRAGDAIPIIFALSGHHSVNDVLAQGSPTSVRVDCDDPGEPTGGEPAESQFDRGLTFNRWTGHYVFTWQTERAWAGTCRTFVLGLSDGSVERLTVSFRSASYRHWYRHR
jgi:DNA-binding beta-propeller fold protein YncE